MKTQLVLALFAALALSACGKMKPLTAEQKAILIQTQENSGRPERATAKDGGSNAAYASTTTDDKLTNIRSRLKSDACQEYPSGSEGLSNIESRSSFSFGVKGKDCPMIFDFTVSGKGNSGTLKTSFKIQDEELRKLNDVYEFEMEFSGSGDEDEMELEGKGTIKSLSQGEVKMEIEAELERDGKKVDGEIVISFEFEDFEAELKLEIEDSEPKYFINDEEVTAKEFNEIMEKGGSGFSRIGKVADGGSVGLQN